MSMFNKFLATMGIGNAKVDTRLEKDTFLPGEQVQGHVEIVGGNVEQSIDEIYLTLNTTYIKEHDDKKYTQTATIERVRINEPFTIGVNEKKVFPFNFNLPMDTPLTYGSTRVWVATGLDIKNAVDPKDADYIKVQPNELIHSLFLALTDLGFKLRNSDCEAAPAKFRGRQPYIQEFEFVPYSGAFRGKLDELELVYFQTNLDSADVYFEIDRRARGLAGLFAEALEMDETRVATTITKNDIPNLASKINALIAKYA
jgi:sporulation-control protein